MMGLMCATTPCDPPDPLCTGAVDEMAGCAASAKPRPQLAASSSRKRFRAVDNDGDEDALCAKLISRCCIAGANEADAAAGGDGSADGGSDGLRRSGRVAARRAGATEAAAEAMEMPASAQAPDADAERKPAVGKEQFLQRRKLRALRKTGKAPGHPWATLVCSGCMQEGRHVVMTMQAGHW